MRDITDIRTLLMAGFLNDCAHDIGQALDQDAIDRVKASAMKTLDEIADEGFIIPEPEIDVDENGMVTFSCKLPWPIARMEIP